VTFSVDFEMAWAFQYSKSSKSRSVELGMRERKQVTEILAVCDERFVPMTWATVGHLCLSSCKRSSSGIAHPELPRHKHFQNNHWDFSCGDWFQNDPCTNVDSDPAWYAPDLVEAIVSARAKHELASHGFSHVSLGPDCPPEVVASELDACIEAMKPFGVRPTTLVFPGNYVGNLNVIAAKGFKTVRAFPFATAAISLPIKIYDGLWGVHSSIDVDKGTESVNLERRLSMLKAHVERAMTHKLSAHFWFHPSLSEIRMRTLLFPLIRYCVELRDQERIDIFTIDRLVKETELAIGKQAHV
jgi:hypothetical protein